MDERLNSYAFIARAAIDVAIPLLTRLFSERFAALHQVLLIIIFEEYFWWNLFFVCIIGRNDEFLLNLQYIILH